jgi:F-type H+-transporting ATPase subunit b
MPDVGLDLSTFLLEILNFLILVWILKRFLYAPVKAAIERRRGRIEQALAEADARREEAERLRSDYESRQADWERERASARTQLQQEMNTERSRRLDQIRRELEQRREKAATQEARRLEEAERRAQEASIGLAARFAARLLSRLAGPDLEARLVGMVLEDLPQLDPDQRHLLAAVSEEGSPTLRVLSAYPLSDAQRAAVQIALEDAAGGELTCEFAQDEGLIAGLQIDAGPLVLHGNLRDELRLFAETAR